MQGWIDRFACSDGFISTHEQIFHCVSLLPVYSICECEETKAPSRLALMRGKVLHLTDHI